MEVVPLLGPLAESLSELVDIRARSLAGALLLDQDNGTRRSAEVDRVAALAHACMIGQLSLGWLHARKVFAAISQEAYDLAALKANAAFLGLFPATSTLPLVVDLDKSLEILWHVQQLESEI